MLESIYTFTEDKTAEKEEAIWEGYEASELDWAASEGFYVDDDGNWIPTEDEY